MPLSPGDAIWGVRLSTPPGEDFYKFIVAEQMGKAGGSGIVYQLLPRTRPPLVAKLYNDTIKKRIQSDARYAKRLVHLATNRNNLAEAMPFAIWPRRLLLSRNNTNNLPATLLGFTMERLQGTQSLHKIINDPAARVGVTPHVTAHIAITLADHVARLKTHHWRFVIGDMTPANIHVSHNFRYVHLIDTDGFQFNTGIDNFPLYGATPGFKSPGSDKAVASASMVADTHDDFVLAINLFMLLMADTGITTHPFQSGGHREDDLIETRSFPFDLPEHYPVPPVIYSAYQKLPAFIREAFTQAFSAHVTAREWVNILLRYRKGL